jgi:hypothetical protein
LFWRDLLNFCVFLLLLIVSSACPPARLEVMLSLMQLGGRAGRAMLRARPWRKVLSDIDDTLKCSGGHFPAGVDRSLPRKAIYPGVLALYRELDLGATDAEEWGPPAKPDVVSPATRAPHPQRSGDGSGGGLAALSAWGNGSGSAGNGTSGLGGLGGGVRAKEELSYLRRDVGNLVFLSARPHVYQDWSERGQYQHFADAKAAQRMHAIPTLLPGDLASGAEYMLSTVKKGDYLPLAKKKVAPYSQLVLLFFPAFFLINSCTTISPLAALHCVCACWAV